MSRSIPTYELYGDLLSGTLVDPVHHETIFERSSKLDWTIGLHRHRHLTQIFLFETAGIRFRAGEDDYVSAEPMILVIPPGTVHGFRFDEDVKGDVLSIPSAEIHETVGAKIERLTSPAVGIVRRSETDRFDDLRVLMTQLQDTYHSVRSERGPLLIALMHTILLTLIEILGATRRVDPGLIQGELNHHERQAQGFCELVERHFAEGMTVENYAARLGVSAPHLTRVCRRILHTAPNELVRRRRMLEAKRLLEYTRLSISEIAHRSGFSDPAFFSRSFKSLYAMTPGQFRQQKGAE